MNIELATGQSLAIERVGPPGSPAVVLLHGLSSSRLSYGPVVVHLAARADVQIVAVDQRGHGESTRAAPDAYDAPSYAADIAALIETLGLAPAIVAGHSLGGVVAGALATARPDLVRALFLEDPPFFEGDAVRRAASPAAKFFPAMVAGVRQLQAAGAPLDAYRVFTTPGDSEAEIDARCRALQSWDPSTMEAALDGTVWRGFDPTVHLAVPVMVLRADPAVGAVFTPEDAVTFAAVNPHAHVIDVPGSAHTIHAEVTLAAYLGHLDAFLSSVDP